MEAAWAPRLRKPLKTCCGSVTIMGHNTSLRDTRESGRPGRRLDPARLRGWVPLGLLRPLCQAWGGWVWWRVLLVLFYRLSLQPKQMLFSVSFDLADLN